MRSATHVFLSLAICTIAAVTSLGQQSDRDRGIALYRQGKFAEAAEVLAKSVETNANDRAAWKWLGAAYVRAGKPDLAIKAFTTQTDYAVRVSPPKYDKSVKVTHKPRALYTEEARQRASTGSVKIVVEFRADGTLGFVFPLETTMDESLLVSAIEAAKGIRFEPAVKNGIAVTEINYVGYSFSMY
jgi:tetratricopeptide (TPR) repeat protein